MDHLASSVVCIFPADLFLHRDKWFAKSCLNPALPAWDVAPVITNASSIYTDHLMPWVCRINQRKLCSDPTCLAFRNVEV